jgi:alpha-beta hydrolase superfamily lysophospholipase
VTRRINLKLDVGAAVGTGEALAIAATIVLGEPDRLAERPVVYFGFPGGGYNRHYYDLQPRGYDGYSQAEFHAEQGDVFVCCDHLGVGESDVPIEALDFEAVGRANAAAARHVLGALTAGELDGAYGARQPACAIGLGQSYGGFVLTIGQATDPVFDAVAMLGWSGIQTLPPWAADVDLAAVLSGRAGDGLDHPMRPWFHHDDEPDDLVIMDMTRPAGTSGSTEAWGASNAPGGPAVLPRNPLEPGVVAAQAAAIGVPVLVACGEVDVVGDPWSEPSAYRSSRDVTVCVFPQMAHMHNFAPTRERLWRRLRAWAIGVADPRI